MKRKLIFITMFLLCSQLCFSQDYCHIQPEAMGNLLKLQTQIRDMIYAANLPYRDHHFWYRIQYDKQSADYRFTTPDSTIQEALGTGIDSLIKAIDLKSESKKRYSGYYGYGGRIRFDSYTDKIFVKLLPNSTVGGIKKEAEPQAFAKKWVAYLDSLQKAREPLLRGIKKGDEVWATVKIESNGSLVLTDTTPYNGLVERFLKQEAKTWQHGILNGRYQRYVFRLKIAPVHRLDIKYSSSSWKKFFRMDKLGYIADGRYIFMSENLKDIPSDTNVVSFVNDQDEYVVPVVHRGKPEEYIWLTETLQNRTSLGKWLFGRHYFERLYFYTDL